MKGTILVVLILVAGVCWSLLRKKLTVVAALTGAVLGWLLYWGEGYTGLALMTVFFILGTLATSWKKGDKRALKPGEGVAGTRHAGQVLANAGVGGLLALGALVAPAYAGLWLVMIAAAFSAAAADTLSSELGMVYGRRFYNILGLRPDRKGLDGVVSLEGMLFGIAGSLVIAGVYSMGIWRWDGWAVVVIVAAGTVGNLCDSVLGAALERRGVLNNDAVNFLNTLTASLVAGLMMV